MLTETTYPKNFWCGIEFKWELSDLFPYIDKLPAKDDESIEIRSLTESGKTGEIRLKFQNRTFILSRTRPIRNELRNMCEFYRGKVFERKTRHWRSALEQILDGNT